MSQAITSPTVPITSQALIQNKAQYQQIGERIAELDGSQAEMLVRIQKLKEEVQNWRQNLDTQVKTYKDELLELKKELSSDVDQLKSEVKEVKNILHMRQNSWAFNLWNFRVEDESENSQESKENAEEFNDNIEKNISNA